VAGKDTLNLSELDTRPLDPSFHHVSHRHLLETVPADEAPQAWVDAVVVPTCRPVDWLSDALTLAKQLGCGLIAMCSGEVKAAEAVERGELEGVPLIAIDVVEDGYDMPPFATSKLTDGTFFSRDSDTSKKRNLALLLARVAGWNRILFLDDDIYGIRPGDAGAVVGLLDRFDVVGMHNAGYPDNSVVCHAYRELGTRQEQFVGAGALAVAPLSSYAFFPNIYNQDWFFVIGHGEDPKVAATGEMRQRNYDPFVVGERPYREEFGDCLAEGLFWLLDHGLELEQADLAHWRDFLSRRGYFLDELIEQISKLDGDPLKRKRMLVALQIARGTFELISPGLCAEYVAWWREDLGTWRKYLHEWPTGLGIDQALEQLNWPGVVRSAAPWPARGVDGDEEEDRLACESGFESPAAGAESTGPAGRIGDSPHHTPSLAGTGALS
jgi:hypothetical protein